MVSAARALVSWNHITRSNMIEQAKSITCDNIFSALRCVAWLKSKRSFGTGSANAASTSGRQKVKTNLRGARSANRRTGTSLDKTNELWWLDLDNQIAGC